MAVLDVKQQVADLLSERRGGSIATTSSSEPSPILKMAIAGGLIGLAGFLILPKMFAPQNTPAVGQGNPQVDQAMQMLQQQQDINRELLKGQQELSAQMIEAQSKAKTVQPSINCFLAVCPGTGSQDATPDGQYAIVGEGIRTARVNPAQVMPQLQQAQPQTVEYYQPPAPAPPVQSVVYSGELASQYTNCVAAGDISSAHCLAVYAAVKQAGGGL